MQLIFAIFETKIIVRALTFYFVLNAILINTRCEIETLLFSFHDSWNNTIFAFLTAYFSILCRTFVDRLPLCCKTRNFADSKFFCISKFDEFDVVNMRFIVRLTLMRDILRMKHLLHDVFYLNLRILIQYINWLDSIYTYHIGDCVCCAYWHKIDILLMHYMCSLYV